MADLGFQADDWQKKVLKSRAKDLLILATRQCGKSTTTAVLGLNTALYHDGSLVLLVSPSLRQSGLLFEKVMAFYQALGKPVAATEDNATTLKLTNGSKIVSLPSNPDTIRGYSGPRLVIIDEAALVMDPVLTSVSPMLATSGGRLVGLSTPFGQRGWFYEGWNDKTSPWDRISITADECPRIPREFLKSELNRIGERAYRQEFFCSFESTLDQVFSTESILAAFQSEESALFGDDGASPTGPLDSPFGPLFDA